MSQETEQVLPMSLGDVLRFDLYFSFKRGPTDYHLLALCLAYRSLFNEPLKDGESFFEKMQTKRFSEVKPAMLAAYLLISSRQMLPDELEKFLPKKIAHYEFDPEIVLANDRKKIEEFVQEKIAPEFNSKLKGSFFKMGGVSAKDVKITKANNPDDVVNALHCSPRFRYEALFMDMLSNTVSLFFTERIPGCESSREIRVMIKDNKIQGISAYHMQGRIKYSKDFISNAISFLEKTLLPRTGGWQYDFCIDLMEKKDGSCQVIEFNPYWTSSPCLYGDWKNIGKPFIIEHDIYNAAEITKKEVAEVLDSFDLLIAKRQKR